MNSQFFTRQLSRVPVKLDWGNWFYGLIGGIIGGAATSASAWVGMTSAKAAGLDVPTLNWKALGVILLSGALTNTFLYLKQSPLPAKESIVETIDETHESRDAVTGGVTEIGSSKSVTTTPVNQPAEEPPKPK